MVECYHLFRFIITFASLLYNNRDNNKFRYTITFMNYGQTERNLSRYDSR